MSIPYMPLYVTDFEADTVHLSVVEDGAYNRLLRLCWRTVGCSVPNDPNWIMKRMRVDRKQFAEVVQPIIDEYFQIKKGRVFSERQQHEFNVIKNKTKIAQKNGQKGGRPRKSLKKAKKDESQTSFLLNPEKSYPEPEPEPYIETKVSLVKVEIQEAFDLYNLEAEKHGLSKAQILTAARSGKIRKRLIECNGIDGWKFAMEQIGQSGFLRGEKTDWKCSLDFFLQASSFTKVMEGNYADNEGPGNGNGNNPQGSGNEMVDAFANLAAEAGDNDKHGEPFDGK